MKLIRITLPLVAMAGSVLSAMAQIDMNAPLPMDTAYTVGRLDNGITYYLRHNEEPKDRASFYIMRKAGALLEEDNQDGLAHFLEHMAFNGTENFPGKGIISTLERYGVAFGRNINAYTAQNETVYNISDVPTGDPALLDTCLLVLHDWSYYLTLDPKEIDEERGVITEEWRSRRDARARINAQTRPVLFKGSMYAVRDVIGSLDVIQNFEPQTIRDFYHKWYRTDLEAIAVVGDINVKEMEARIIEMFSSIPAIENPAPRPRYFEVPEHDETYYVLATDPEISRTNISITTFARDTLSDDFKKTPAYMRGSVLESLYNAMVSNRIKEIMQKPDAPFLGASFGVSGFVPGYTSFSISTSPRPNEEARALAAVMTEYERARRYGFTDDELKPIIANTLAGLENSYKRKDKISNESHISDVKAHFLQDATIVSFDTYYEIMKEILPSISAAEISALAPRWDTTHNRVFTITGPEQGEEFLTESRMHAIIDSVRGADIRPYDYKSVEGALLDEIPAAGKIVKTRQLPRFDATEWTLSNGAKVVFRKADYEKDVVSLVGFSWGGTSLYDVDMLPAAGTSASMVQAFGIGDHSPLDLQKVLSGNTASAKTGIGSLSETVSGSCAPKDLETMFQLVYMKFAKPRYDEELFNTLMERQRISYERSKDLPRKQMSDSLTRILANYHPRALTLDSAYLDAVTIDRVKEVYEDRLKDASDFTFFIVGDVEADSVRQYVEQYLGAIESINRKETWRDNKVRSPKGKVEKTITLDLPTPKSTVVVSIRNTKMKYNNRNNILMDILEGVLQLRYTENIREKEGGTYGVSVQAGADRRPYTCYSLSMQFECDPDRVADLKPLLYVETEKLAKDGSTQEEFDKVVKNMIKNHEQSKPHNSYWMGALQNYYIEGEDITDPKNFEGIINKLTPRDLRKFAEEYFKNTDIVDITFAPKQ